MLEIPAWILKILQGMGLTGAIIALLLMALGGAISSIALLLRHAAKVYKYRLEERDRLLEALNKSSGVLADLLEVTKDRNEIVQEQANLIKAQSTAFEILRVTIIGQFESIKQNHNISTDNHKAVASSVAAIADALRVVNQMTVDNRIAGSDNFSSMRQLLQDMRTSLHDGINVKHEALLTEFRTRLAQICRGEPKRIKRDA